MRVSRMPAVTKRTPANRAGGRLLTAILVNRNAEPHTRYTAARHRMSLVEWPESRKLNGVARSSGAENPVANTQQQRGGNPLRRRQGDSKSQYLGVVADPNADGDEYAYQGLAGNQYRRKQHAVLRKLFMIVRLMMLAMKARHQLRDDAARQHRRG